MSRQAQSFELGTSNSSGPLLCYQCAVVAVTDASTQSSLRAPPVDITAQKREIERLRRSEALLMDAQGVAHLGTWQFTPSQGSVGRSPELYAIYGVKPEEFQPTFDGFIARVHPEDRERVRRTLIRVFEERISFSHDERVVRPDGSVRHLHTWGHPELR